MNKLLDLRIDYKTYSSDQTDWRTGPIYHLDGLTCPAQMFLRVVDVESKFKIIEPGHMKAISYGANGWTIHREKLHITLNNCNNNKFFRKILNTSFENNVKNSSKFADISEYSAYLINNFNLSFENLIF